MGIRNIQVTRTIESIIKKYLFEGIYPTFTTITHHFSQWLRDNDPGAPGFKPISVMRREKSDANTYNENTTAIHTDVSDAYQATIQQTDQLMNDFNFIETERQKLTHALTDVSNRIDELLLIANNTDYRHYDGRVISFEDMSSVNKAMSSVLVNIKNKEATLKENFAKSNRVLITRGQVSFEPLVEHKNQAPLEPMKNAFDDNINTAWWHVVKTDVLQPKVKAQLTIMFEKEEEVNYIEYVPHHGKPVSTKLEYTLDGASFTSVNQQGETDRVTGTKTWTFQKIRAAGIRFVFEKTEHDERTSNLYQYYFGAKSINIHKKNYLSKGMLYSNPISFDENVKKLSMFSKHDMPFNTDIRYEVALHENNKPLEELIWHPISSSDETRPKQAKVVDLNIMERKKVEFDQCMETGEVINGMRVFSLVKDNGSSIATTFAKGILDKESFDNIRKPKLFRGINQWKRERAYRPFRGDIPLNSDWEDAYRRHPHTIRINYQPIGRILSLKRSHGGVKDNFYRFTTCVYSDEKKDAPLSLSVIQTLTSGVRKRLGSYSVYLNQKRLAPINDEVTLKFDKGWNEIKILYHWGDMEERRDFPEHLLPNKTTVNKFEFERQEKVRADLKHLEAIDVHTLFHNVSPNNRSYFSIHERQVVLNYLPENCIFQLTYETNRKMEKNDTVVVRAHVSRNEETPYITPKIYNIRLRAR